MKLRFANMNDKNALLLMNVNSTKTKLLYSVTQLVLGHTTNRFCGRAFLPTSFYWRGILFYWCNE
uniref:Uncharacterized protein n=1 Tax=Nelumbo nucifera TaxID=4432 RepID=A0A822XRZ8_NELNU|nr:TPA_asm: hypothetical protein HUJ06_024570 [Nelumbo nucifera]